MSTRSTEAYPDDVPGFGWLIFAGTMLVLAGMLNVVYGIAAIADSRVFERDVSFAVGDLGTWGWFLLIAGAAQVTAALSIWGRTGWGRWVGIASASVNVIVQMLVLPAEPSLAVCAVFVDVLVLYGLVAYGQRAR